MPTYARTTIDWPPNTLKVIEKAAGLSEMSVEEFIKAATEMAAHQILISVDIGKPILWRIDPEAPKPIVRCLDDNVFTRKQAD